MSRRCIVLVIILILLGFAFFVRSKLSLHARGHCSNTDYGHGVTCINGAGVGGANANITSKTVAYGPIAGHAVIAAAYTCADGNCQDIPVTTLKISDDVNDPEPCFTASPHSPFALNETSSGTQKLQEYIWMCPNIPPGVTSFTATCSAAHSCSYIALTVTEWTGLATSNVFDVDGGAASTTQQTMATISTWSATNYTNDLLYAFLDNTGDEVMTPGPPYRTALQFWPGNINTATMANTTGIQTATTTWKGKDDWYGAIAAIKSATSQPRALTSFPRDLSILSSPSFLQHNHLPNRGR